MRCAVAVPPASRAGWSRPRPPPHKRAVGATFLLRVPLPARSNGKYDSAGRPSSTPTLLKPGDGSRNPVRPSPSRSRHPDRQGRPLRRRSSRRCRNGKEDLGAPGSGPPEYREAPRKAAKDWREKAKELGLCQHCRGPKIPNQTSARHSPRSAGSHGGITTPRDEKRGLPRTTRTAELGKM